MRGPETIYPQPFGEMTAGAQKDYPVDYSHFNITGTIASHHQKEYELFTNVNLETRLGRDKGIKLKLPLITTGLGSTKIAQKHFLDLGVGAAICGTGIVIGENVVGMDEKSKFDSSKKVTEYLQKEKLSKSEIEISEEQIAKLIEERNSARADKNWEKSDEIRDYLNSKGICIEDCAQGTIWRVKT